MQYTPEYDEIITKTRILVDTVEWIYKIADKMAQEGLTNYSLSLQSKAMQLERLI